MRAELVASGRGQKGVHKASGRKIGRTGSPASAGRRQVAGGCGRGGRGSGERLRLEGCVDRGGVGSVGSVASVASGESEAGRWGWGEGREVWGVGCADVG